MRSWRRYGIGLVGLIVGLGMFWQPSPALAAPAPSPGKPALYDFGRQVHPLQGDAKGRGGVKSDYGDQVEFRLVYDG